MRFQILALLLGLLASTVNASLIFAGTALSTGGGIGTSNVVLTIQNTGTEQGCVGRSGIVDVIGSAACPGGLNPAILGGNEKTASSQTQTRSITQTNVTSASNLVVLLNFNEPAGQNFTVQNLSLTIYSGIEGAILFNSGNLTAPVTYSFSLLDPGDLGLLFVLDGAEAAAAQPFLSDVTNRFGLAGYISGTAGSNETFSIADRSAVTITAPTPEPGSADLAILGLLSFGTLALRAKRSE